MKKHIVCFGDSNTHGYCAEPWDCADHGERFNEEERWTCLLAKQLGEEYLVLEEGLGGRTTVFQDPLTEGLCGIDVIFPVLMSHEPVDLLVIMLGTNDTKERFGCNACAFLCKTEKNVLGANVVLTHAFGGLNREVYRLVCFLSEAFDVEHIHTPPCLVINLLYNPKLCEFISQERRPFDVAVMRRKGFAQIYAERRGLYGCHKLVDLRRRYVLYLSR